MNPGGIFLAFVLTLLLSSPGECATICDEESCSCSENQVVCQGSEGEHLELSPSSLPEATYSLSVSSFASVNIKTNTFSATPDLGEISMTDLDKLNLEEFVFSEEENDGFLESFNIENVGKLELTQESFDNSPQCNKATIKNVNIESVPTGGIKLYADTMKIEDCKFGELNEESIYSDSMNFIFLGNSVGHVKTYGFSGSNNVFNFSNNHIEKMESNAISVAFLNGDISRYSFVIIYNFLSCAMFNVSATHSSHIVALR